MTRSVCASLLHANKFDAVDMATRFTKEYINEKTRGYGANIKTVFNIWTESGISKVNVFEPSYKQFGGSGSYGNGAAMRVAPVALFSETNSECIKVNKHSVIHVYWTTT